MQVSWKKHLRPIAALVALFTVGGLFGAVSANASGTTGGTTSSTTGGGYSIVVKPYDSEQSLTNVIISARPIDSDMARQACESAGVTTPASLPAGLMSLSYSDRMIVASAMMNQSTLPTPSATRTGEGALKVPTKGLWLVSSQFGFTVANAPGSVKISGYMKTEDTLSKKEVQKLDDVKVQKPEQTNANASAARNMTSSVRNATLIERRGSRKSIKKADYNTYNDTQVAPVGVGRLVQWSSDIRTHYFTWGGHPVICQDPMKLEPDNGATYAAYTWADGMNIPSVGGDLKRAFYYGYGGPGNIFQNPDDALIATHYVVAFKLGHPVPDGVKTSWQYQSLMNIADHGATGVEQTEIIQLHPTGNANPRRQWLIFAVFHGYNISATTQVQTTKDNGKEPWINGGTTADGKYVYGEIDHDTNWVRDTVTVTAHDGIKPTGAMFNIDYWLNCKTADGKKYAVKKSQANQLSGVIWQNQSATVTGPAFTSMDLWGKPYWPMDATFWFDIDILRGANNDASTWPAGVASTRGENDKNESWFRKPTDLTVATEARYYDANGNRVSASPMLNGSQSVLDHLMITPKDQWVRSNETLTYTVILNYDYNKDGTVDKSVTKTKTESTYGGWATGQIHEADSDKFTASDLGLKDGWKPGTYWFDVTVSRSDIAAAPSLSKDSYTHEGKDDAKEKFEIQPHFQLNFVPSVSTKVTTGAARDGKPVKDQVTVTMPSNRTDLKVTGVTVKARGRLYWSPDKGTEGKTVPANARKIADLTPLTFTSDMLADGSETLTYDPLADNALKAVGAQSRLGTGYYTYVWRLDKSDLVGQTATVTWTVNSQPEAQQYPMRQLLQYMDSTVSDGWKPGAEQTGMAAAWTPAILKVGHVGQADGKWMDGRPAANAILNMVETTDATGRTPTATAQTSQIQLKTDGTGVFPTQAIGMGETRYYKVWESQVGKPFNKPKNDAYWMVTAKQVPGTTGVQLTVTGTSDETRWLVRTWTGTDNGTSAGSALKNNPVDWTIKLGDTLDANVTPPVTGSDGDTLRAQAAVAGAVTVAGLGAALALTRRRTHAGRHSA